ncbi:hypothetical protein V6N13_103416 [Hibiscus sabdariffa]|uniref:Uncharacterized protein n=2 Tax=Hibiscus sabdariffa TaxID=183260 RepID=A0ABR1ZM84_9ROSI
MAATAVQRASNRRLAYVKPMDKYLKAEEYVYGVWNCMPKTIAVDIAMILKPICAGRVSSFVFFWELDFTAFPGKESADSTLEMKDKTEDENRQTDIERGKNKEQNFEVSEESSIAMPNEPVCLALKPSLNTHSTSLVVMNRPRPK